MAIDKNKCLLAILNELDKIEGLPIISIRRGFDNCFIIRIYWPYLAYNIEMSVTELQLEKMKFSVIDYIVEHANKAFSSILNLGDKSCVK